MSQKQAEVKSTALVEISLKDIALQEIGAVGAGIAVLTEKYAGMVYDVTKTSEMEAAKAARLDIRERRYKIPHIVKDKKQALKKIGDDIEAEGERIVGLLLELETPIHEQIKGEEDRKAEIKRLEVERKEQIAARISKIKSLPVAAVGFDIPNMRDLIASVEGMVIDDKYQEFQAEAETARKEVLASLLATLAVLLEKEADDLRIKAEQDERDRIAKIQDNIRVIKSWPLGLAGFTHQQLSSCYEGFLKDELEGDYAEFLPEANQAKADALAEIKKMIVAAKSAEDAAAQLKSDREKMDAAEKERTRIAGIKDLIAAIKAEPLECLDLSSSRIRLRIKDSKMDRPVDKAVFQEFTVEADGARINSLAKMTKMAEAAELSEKAENERLQAQRDADAERDRLAEEKRLQDKAAAEKEEKDRADALALENQEKLDALTATHLSTLQAILAMAEDKAVTPKAALTGIIHLAKLGIERGQA